MLLGSPSTVVTRQFIRLPVTISILVVTTGSVGGISAEKSGLELGPCFDTDAWRGFKLWQLQRAAGLCVIQSLRLAGAAYGGIKETSTTVCGDEGRCVVFNLRKAGCSLIADCSDGDRHEIERNSRGLAGRHATPRLWGQALRGCVQDVLHEVHGVREACCTC